LDINYFEIVLKRLFNLIDLLLIHVIIYVYIIIKERYRVLIIIITSADVSYRNMKHIQSTLQHNLVNLWLH
jgi:hypothetical protein